MKARDVEENLGVDGRIVLKCVLGKLGGKVWIGCIWLKIENSSGIL
jgi:hypothetical protein